MEELRIVTSTGNVLYLRSVWNPCHGHIECGSAIDVYNEDGEYLHEIAMEMPDTNDPDFDMDDFVQTIEDELDFIADCLGEYDEEFDNTDDL